MFHHRGRLEILVSVKEIAEFAEVKASSVSTWRARRPDFPEPKRGGAQPLFDVFEVEEWLTTSAPERGVGRRRLRIEPLQWWRKSVEAFISEQGGAASRAGLVALIVLSHAAKGVSGPDRWARVAAHAAEPAMLQRVADEMEQADPNLRGLIAEPILRLFDSADTVAPQAAGELVVDLVRYLTAARDDATTTSSDLLRVALEVIDLTTPQKGAATLTSEQLAELMVALAGISPGDTVLDPAAGEGQLLATCARELAGDVHLLGQELADAPWRVARSRLLIEGAAADLGPAPGDSLRRDNFPGVRADAVLIDPPLGRVPGGQGSDQPPPVGRWLEHGLGHLAPYGRLVMVVPVPGLASSSSRVPPDELVSQLGSLAEAGRVETVVLLPRRSRPDVSEPTAIIVVRSADVASAAASSVRLLALASATGSGRVDKETSALVGELARLVRLPRSSWAQPNSGISVLDIEPPALMAQLKELTKRTPNVASADRTDKSLAKGRPSAARANDEVRAIEIAELRSELRLMRERMDGIRAKAAGLEEALAEALEDLRRSDPGRYQRVLDRLHALMRRL